MLHHCSNNTHKIHASHPHPAIMKTLHPLLTSVIGAAAVPHVRCLCNASTVEHCCCMHGFLHSLTDCQCAVPFRPRSRMLCTTLFSSSPYIPAMLVPEAGRHAEAQLLQEPMYCTAFTLQTSDLFQLKTARLCAQGQRYFTGHWFYSLWNTALVVTHEGKDGQDTFQEEPIQLAASRLFRSSEHDNAMWGCNFGNVQSLNTIHRYVACFLSDLRCGRSVMTHLLTPCTCHRKWQCCVELQLLDHHHPHGVYFLRRTVHTRAHARPGLPWTLK